MKTVLTISAVVGVAVLGLLVWQNANETARSGKTDVAASGSALVDIILPDTLSANAQIGKRGFDTNCAVCHGTNAVGQDGVAPPLVHIIYEPSHHGDESFLRATVRGVRGHHWPFGDMPPVEGLTRGDVTMITAYIRELQRANGIN